MKFGFAVTTLLLATAVQADIKIQATNKLPFERKSQTIELSGEVLEALKPRSLAAVRVKDESGADLLTQVVDTDWDDLRKPDIVIFQADFGPNESKTFTLSSARGARKYDLKDFKAHGRFVRERFDDFAWENDRIAHRTYGAALKTWKGEPLISNTIDIWSKRTTRMVQDEWYMIDDYHTDRGDGADFYSAGKSRGCGGDGLWANDQLYVGENFTNSRVLSNGPIRVLFELDYDAFDAGGRKVSAVRRISLDAGSNLDHVTVIYKPEGGTEPLIAGIGLKKVEGEKVDFNAERGVLTKWEKVEKNAGMQGLAIIADPKAVEKQAEDQLNQLLLVRVPSDNKLSYWAGFFWDKAGHFDSYEAWKTHVDQCAQGAASPIELTVVGQ